MEYRPKGFVSLVGALRLSRAYYHCGGRGRGGFPWDATLRLSPRRLTPAAEEATALAGVQESFGKAADRTPRKLAGLRLCESAVERTTEAAGPRRGACLAEGMVFGLGAAWDWNRDAAGRTCAYPRSLRNGWQIASGAVESACKTVVNQRLCLGGMRWGEQGVGRGGALACAVSQRPGSVGRLPWLRHGRVTETPPTNVTSTPGLSGFRWDGEAAVVIIRRGRPRATDGAGRGSGV